MIGKRLIETTMKLLSRVILLLVIGTQNAFAEVSVSSLFTDHMVLQRDKQVRVWGKASPNEEVSISILGKRYKTIASAVGEWEILLPKHPKAGPFEITIAGENSLTIKDAYYGDVWIASGQSNMEWHLADGVFTNDTETVSAHFPKIRFFEIPKTFSPKKLDEVPTAEWRVTSPGSVGEFSAVAWFFAKELHLAENVAVGIIESNWGGTPAEAWTSLGALKNVEGYQQAVKNIEQTNNWDELVAENEAKNTDKWNRITKLDVAMTTGAHKLDFDDDNWALIDLPLKEALHDFVWLRKAFDLSAVPFDGIIIDFGDIHQNAMVFVNGKLVATKDWSNNISRYTVKADFLKVGKNLVALRANHDWNNRVFVGQEGNMYIQVGDETRDLSRSWRMSNTLEAPMPEVQRYSDTASFLYNAMIDPLLPFSAKGVIWYQGESNVGAYQYYHKLFTSMIENWRQVANSPDLPFLFVQLSAFQARQELQADSAWAFLREAQRQTLQLNDTGMAVSIDIGNANDIHPRNKRDVGLRLWRQAAKKVYGLDIVPGGPEVTSVIRRGADVLVTFANADGLQTTDTKAPEGFIISGKDGQFKIAAAKIEGQSVVLSHPDISEPVEVRYAWADNPAVNLVNSQALPAVPFKEKL